MWIVIVTAAELLGNAQNVRKTFRIHSVRYAVVSKVEFRVQHFGSLQALRHIHSIQFCSSQTVVVVAQLSIAVRLLSKPNCIRSIKRTRDELHSLLFPTSRHDQLCDVEQPSHAKIIRGFFAMNHATAKWCPQTMTCRIYRTIFGSVAVCVRGCVAAIWSIHFVEFSRSAVPFIRLSFSFVISSIPPERSSIRRQVMSN